MEVYDKLFSCYGKRHWWPADTPFEVLIGAILTQNTNWKNAEKAIDNLKKTKNLNIEKIAKMEEKELENMIKPSGFYRQKAERLQNFCNFILEDFGSVEKMFRTNPKKLRSILLDFRGIGPETADSILLYAGELPFFVIDAYTKRIFRRIGYDIGNNYEEMRTFFENNIPKDVELYKEYHALIVELAKVFCRKKPLCGKCPVKNNCNTGKKNN